jgi:hypothetical protein
MLSGAHSSAGQMNSSHGGFQGLDEKSLELVARAIHESYRFRQLGMGKHEGPSTQDWEMLPEPLKESNRRQAADIARKLSCIGAVIVHRETHEFTWTPNEVEMLAEQEHMRWVAEKQAGGWTRGEEKCAADKTHPMLIPYDELPDPEKQKDRNAVLDIPGILRQVGLGICREKGAAGRSPKVVGN